MKKTPHREHGEKRQAVFTSKKVTVTMLKGNIRDYASILTSTLALNENGICYRFFFIFASFV